MLYKMPVDLVDFHRLIANGYGRHNVVVHETVSLWI